MFLFCHVNSTILSATSLPHALKGAIWTFGGLLLCFLITHLVLFVRSKQKEEPPPTEEKPVAKEQAPAKQEPVYYIVEKKRRRVKPSYGEPKEIKFR